MGRDKTKRGNRLRGVAAGLAAVAAAFMPAAVAASPASLPQAVETDSRTAARMAHAEDALAQAIARSDRATLRVFACDCAARVAPLYERFGGTTERLAQARARAVAARQASEQRPAAPPEDTGAFGAACAQLEQEIVALEREVASEATVTGSAKVPLRRLAFAKSEQFVSRLEDDATNNGATSEPAFRMLAVAMTAAEAIDQALLVAVGGSVSRIGAMCEAIAEATFLDHVFRRSDATAAINAVFRELAWQRRHLRALQSNA